jgi:NADH:ubiquinone oxidoreductase subunit K
MFKTDKTGQLAGVRGNICRRAILDMLLTAQLMLTSQLLTWIRQPVFFLCPAAGAAAVICFLLSDSIAAEICVLLSSSRNSSCHPCSPVG